MESIQNMLIIVGTDRNAGKTTLACKIIENVSYGSPVVAVKISPHFHPVGPEEEVMIRTDTYIIIKERDPGSGKDSSRFLRAGAQEVYYMQVWDRGLSPAFEKLISLCGRDKAMVIESGWLRNLVKPGLFLIVNRKGNAEFKDNIQGYRQLAHIWVEFDGKGFSPPPERIIFSEGKWKLRLTDD